MEPDGFLVLGAAETVVGLTDTFKPFRTGAASIGRTIRARRKTPAAAGARRGSRPWQGCEHVRG